MEDMSWLDKQTGIPREWSEGSIALHGGCLERPRRGCADGHNTPATFAASVENFSRPRRELGPLGVHHMVANLLGFNRSESTNPDMQGQIDPVDAPRGQFLENCLTEMQAGRGRGDRTRPRGENSLIPCPVARRSLAPSEYKVAMASGHDAPED